jgi:hypothetical protein
VVELARAREEITALRADAAAVSTIRKNGLHVITALRDAVTGNPWLPTTVEMT